MTNKGELILLLNELNINFENRHCIPENEIGFSQIKVTNIRLKMIVGYGRSDIIFYFDKSGKFIKMESEQQ